MIPMHINVRVLLRTLRAILNTETRDTAFLTAHAHLHAKRTFMYMRIILYYTRCYNHAMDQTDQLRDVLEDLTSVFHDDRVPVEFDAQPRADLDGKVYVNPDVSDLYDVDVSGEQELRCLVDTLSHEVEHVRESDLDGKRRFMQQYPEYAKFAGYVTNVLEDAYIDHTRTRRHRGLKKPHAFFVDRQLASGPSLADMGDDPRAFAACLFQLAHAGTATGIGDAHPDVQEFAARVQPIIDRVRRLETPDDRNALAHIVMRTALDYLPDLDDFDPDNVPGVPNEVMANGPDPDDIETADAQDAPDDIDADDIDADDSDADARDADEDDAGGTPDGDAEGTPDASQDDEDAPAEGGADDDATDDASDDAGDDTDAGAAGDVDDDASDVGDDAMDNDESDVGDASDASDTGDDAQQPQSADDAQNASDDADDDALSDELQDRLDEMADRAERDDPSREWHDIDSDDDYHEPDASDRQRYRRLKRKQREALTDLASKKRWRDQRAEKYSSRVDAAVIEQEMENSGLKQDVIDAFRQLKTRDRDIRARSGSRVNIREYVANRAGDKSRNQLYLRRQQAEIGDRAVGVAFDASGSMDDFAARQALAAIALACDVIGDQFCAMAYSGGSADLVTAPDESFEWDHLDAFSSGGNTPMPAGIQATRSLLATCHKPERLMLVVTDGKANVALSGSRAATTARRESAELVNAVRHDDNTKVIGLGVGSGVSDTYMDTVFSGSYVRADMGNLADKLIEVYRNEMKVA